MVTPIFSLERFLSKEGGKISTFLRVLPILSLVEKIAGQWKILWRWWPDLWPKYWVPTGLEMSGNFLFFRKSLELSGNVRKIFYIGVELFVWIYLDFWHNSSPPIIYLNFSNRALKLKCSSTMLKVFNQEQLEIPSLWNISEHSNSKLSSTMVKVFTQSNHKFLLCGALQSLKIQNFLQPWSR